ncbi:hypothetical protein ACQPYH_05400 [Kribbella sp. CA-245084]|uniref:hypothetical protein n=1 Tax=Kribbella sp. CA-245084 TaxID=3239940 RepID=UPI003D8B36AA
MTMLDSAQALGHLPESLRGELLAEYGGIAKNFSRREWRVAELNGGRFSEIVYSILRGHVDGSYPDTAYKPDDFPSACRNLGKADKATFPQSVRLGIPRVLVGLYDIRNNRDVGHVGGDVDANHMDASYVLYAAQWVMAELVRLFHDTEVVVATEVVDALVDRTVPMIWEVAGRRRILQPSMKLADKTLLLLYGSITGVNDTVLASDLKHARLRDYKKVLRSLDAQVMVEYDEESGLVSISPLGEIYVQDKLLPSLSPA